MPALEDWFREAEDAPLDVARSTFGLGLFADWLFLLFGLFLWNVGLLVVCVAYVAAGLVAHG